MRITKISFLLIFIGLILYSHATPEMAIRSRVLLMGYPAAAMEADIVAYEYESGIEDEDEQGYRITNPPIERATGGELDTYVVSKKLWFYFARFEKDV